MIVTSSIAIFLLFSLFSSFTLISALKTRPHFRRNYKLQSNLNSEGYGPIGSLLRQGPVPFFIRVVNPSTYNAAVEKYMKLEKCDRLTAQANMDAYFMDPNGWASEQLKSRRTGIKMDYTKANMSPESLVLTGIWSILLAFILGRIIQVQVLHL